MDGEELATPARSATPSHVDTRKKKREKTAEQKKKQNCTQRQNKEKRLKTAEKAVPELLAGVRVAEEQKIALTETLLERELRAQSLAQHLADKKEACATAIEAQRVAEQAARDHQSALLRSEAQARALQGELAIAEARIAILESEVARFRFLRSLANASAVNRAILCSHAIRVARDLASLAEKVIQETAAADSPPSSPSLSLHADSPRSFERTPIPDVRPFSPSPPPGYMDP
jgi:hypothetical protein